MLVTKWNSINVKVMKMTVCDQDIQHEAQDDLI